MSHKRRRCRALSTAVATLLVVAHASDVAADGVVVSKVYDPYVQPLEQEIEWRIVDQDSGMASDLQRQSFGFGWSLADRWSAELYALAVQESGESFTINACELEAKWQLTEQGEFAFDWGLLFELERATTDNTWEWSTTLLASRDFGRATLLANLGILYEWGEHIDDEVDSTLQLQLRYRLRERFEPAVEVHVGQDTTAVGPAILGLLRTSGGHKLLWELGAFAGVGENSPDRILKASMEYEF